MSTSARKFSELLSDSETSRDSYVAKREELQLSELTEHSQQTSDWIKHRKRRPYEALKAKQLREKELRQWFESLDKDHSGDVSLSELVGPMLALGYVDTKEEVENYLRKVQANRNGNISFKQFLQVMNKKNPSLDSNPLEDFCTSFRDSTSFGHSQLSLQTEIPVYRRKQLLESLYAYDYVFDETKPSSKDKRFIYNREKTLRRCKSAIEYDIEDSKGCSSPTKNPCTIKETRKKLLKESQFLRDRLEWREKLKPNREIDNKILALYGVPDRDCRYLKEIGRQKESSGKGRKSSTRTGGEKVVTYTYRDGESLPHATVVKVPNAKPFRVRKVRRPPTGSAAGKVPDHMKEYLDIKFQGLRLKTPMSR